MTQLAFPPELWTSIFESISWEIKEIAVVRGTCKTLMQIIDRIVIFRLDVVIPRFDSCIAHEPAASVYRFFCIKRFPPEECDSNGKNYLVTNKITKCLRLLDRCVTLPCMEFPKTIPSPFNLDGNFRNGRWIFYNLPRNLSTLCIYDVPIHTTSFGLYHMKSLQTFKISSHTTLHKWHLTSLPENLEKLKIHNVHIITSSVV